MDAIRKQASKLREQVAKQQQAILRQLGQISNEPLMTDESEIECHQQLRKLYTSTKTAKHFQRHIVRGIEGIIAVSSKQMEIVRKLAKDFCKYGTENEGSSYPLAGASLQLGNSYETLENEKETLLGILGDQISEPLRAQITGAPLEDARHLTQRYDKLRQEVEAQAAEVLRRRSKLRNSSVSAENSMRLQTAETRLKELKSALTALGREATAAMLSVEEQQQQITLHSLCTMVDAERAYHRNALVILEKLYSEMIVERPPMDRPSKESSLFPPPRDGHNQPTDENANSNGFDHKHNSQTGTYFFAKVIHPFDAQAEGELSLSIDDYVVVRQVGANGWSEGECKGNAGWFPSAYVQRQDLIPASKEYTGGGLACCFCFSTNNKKKSTKSRGSFLSSEHVELGKSDEILSDISTFSVKEQERRLKKALEDEQKVSKEAERVVQWVKQESAKIDASVIKRVLRDDEEEEKGTKF